MNEIASTLLSIFIIFLIYGFVDYLFFLWRLRKYKKVRKELGYDEEGEVKKSVFDRDWETDNQRNHKLRK